VTKDAGAAAGEGPGAKDANDAKDGAPDQAARAGRGGVAVLGAKVFFILTGFIQQPLLRLAIGAADYGALSRVFAVSNVFNNVLVSGSTQGVSRTVAAAGEAEREALRATLRVHAAIATLAACTLALVAPLVAWFQATREVLAPLVAMAGVLGIYGVYAPLIGYLNGRARFTRQASLDIVAATLRTAGLLGVGYLFARHGATLAGALQTSPGVLGATIGAVLASLGVFLLALRWTGTGRSFATRPAAVPNARAYVALIVPVMVAQLFTNGLMQGDIFVLGRYLSLGALTVPGLADPDKTANEWVGVYRACQLFAFLPYQLLFSVTQILFPLLARAQAEEGPARVAELVRRGTRIGAIVCGACAFVVLSMPHSLVAFAYGKAVGEQSGATLSILGLGQVSFAMLGLATTVLVSLGRERTAMALTALALTLLVGACRLTIPSAAFGSGQLEAAALGATGALAIALVVGTFVVRGAAGAFIPASTALRVGACLAAAFFVGRHMPIFGRVLTVAIAAGLGVVYLVLLTVTRELSKDDLALALSIAKRRRAAADR
jgi:stage V sporulation protein B